MTEPIDIDALKRRIVENPSLHPILDLLKRRIANLRPGGISEGEREVLAHGKPFLGIKRPKGFRHQMTRKACFRNAGLAAIRQGMINACGAHSPWALVEHFRASEIDPVRAHRRRKTGGAP
jgi:hypothetical protein